MRYGSTTPRLAYTFLIKLLSFGGVALIGLIPATTVLAQDPPATTFQPGPWQPVERIDPQQPVQILLINQTDLALEYGLTGPNDSVFELPVGQITQFSISMLPTFLSINGIERAALKYNLTVNTVNQNLIRIEVTRLNDVSGDRTLNIDDTGAIYIY